MYKSLSGVFLNLAIAATVAFLGAAPMAYAAGLARAATLTWESSATGLLDVLARVVRQRRSKD